MGCNAVIGARQGERQCNATCEAAASHFAAPWNGTNPVGGCSYTPNGTNTSWEMCSVCGALPAPAWWPTSIKPPNGEQPAWWPIGYSLAECSSCESIDGDEVGECKLGCMFGSKPAAKPVPPTPPVPPAARGDAPACGVFPAADEPGFSPCKIGPDVNFSTVFADHAVLQMMPARAAVYGYLGKRARPGSSVSITVSVRNDASGHASTVAATVDVAKGTWKSLLNPTCAGGSYTIEVVCSAGCTGRALLSDVTFGDVYYCFGQSNMALPFEYTYARNTTIASIKKGAFSSIRVTGLKGNMNIDQPW